MLTTSRFSCRYSSIRGCRRRLHRRRLLIATSSFPLPTADIFAFSIRPSSRRHRGLRALNLSALTGNYSLRDVCDTTVYHPFWRKSLSTFCFPYPSKYTLIFHSHFLRLLFAEIKLIFRTQMDEIIFILFFIKKIYLYQVIIFISSDIGIIRIPVYLVCGNMIHQIEL